MPKRPGDHVVSGSLNAGGVIHARAVRTSGDSTLAQIIRLVERAMSSRAPIERTVDRVSRIFVPAVILLALCDFAALVLLHAGVGPALMRATTILVIACPCALGLATPLAITAAVGSASRAGLLIADSRALETMGAIDTMVLDKTGTVTEGDFRLVEFAVLPVRCESYAYAAAGAGETTAREPEQERDVFLEEHLPMLTALEAYSEHLLGRAVVRFAQEHRASALKASDVEIRKGEGICGTIGGRRVFIGTRQLMTAEVRAPGPGALQHAQEWQQMGRTAVFYGWDGDVHGLLAFGDRIKSGAAEMVQRLRLRGIAIKLVSGDAWPTTESVARQIGVDDFTAETRPGAKVRTVEELQRSGKKVAMLGDGVNDAPALAQADLGIALGTGADIAMNAAPIVLVSGSLAKVEEVFRLAAKTTQVVRQNLFWAFFYNAVGITLAVSGVLTPIFAAGAMLFSSTSVIVNSMRVFRPGKT